MSTRPTLLALALLVTACGPHPYNFARTYEPLRAERDFFDDASTSPPFEEVLRDPARYEKQLFSWFGSVESLEVGEDGTQIHLVHRIHQARHLCSDRTSGSCRLTVSKRPGPAFVAQMALHPEDKQGKDRLWAGSLVRVYGQLDTELQPDAPPRVIVRYYRHWPHGTWVSTAARATMRR